MNAERTAKTCPCGESFYGGEDKCPQCSDRERFDAVRIRQEESLAARLTAIRQNVPDALARAGTPTLYRNLTRASWEARYKAWEDSGATKPLIAWLGRQSGGSWPTEAPSDWLVMFYGLYGRRKTGLATALLGELLCAGRGGLWIDACDWIERQQRGIANGTAGAVYDEAAEVDVLVIDDLCSVLTARDGTKRDEQAWWRERLALLLRHRHAHVKTTIVTANIERLEELARIDGSLVSRMDVPHAYELKGEDRRR